MDGLKGLVKETLMPAYEDMAKEEAEKEFHKVDNVHNPKHYNTGAVECIDAIKSSMSSEAFQGYLKGNCLKYIWRMSYKGKALEDTKKAKWYLNKLIEEIEDNG